MSVDKTKVMRIPREPSAVHIVIMKDNYLASKVTNNTRCTREIKSVIAMAIAAFSRKNTLFTSKLDLKLKKNEVL
jgi:hypothetical protein